MEIIEIRPGVFAVDRPGMNTNCGFVRTAEGVVVIDTTSSYKTMGEILNMAGVDPSEVCLVINTHFHNDHTKGNLLFDCPIVGHRLTAKRVSKRKTMAKRHQPGVLFDDRYETEVGGVRFEVIHTGGHTPDSSVVWLPETKVLFCGDLIFSYNHPVLFVTPDYYALVKALKWLPSLEAEVIVPGHGRVCDYEAVDLVLEYLEASWALTKEHIANGDSLEQTLADKNYPKIEGGSLPMYIKNIEWMYKKASKE
jgi:cyclase